MITGASTVSIYVSDQDRALDFYINKLGFRKLVDEPVDSGARWIEVAPAEAQTRFVLYTPPGQENRIGTFSNVVFSCEDLKATHEALRRRGVEFSKEPTRQLWGRWAQFKDVDGNEFGLIERGKTQQLQQFRQALQTQGRPLEEFRQALEELEGRLPPTLPVRLATRNLLQEIHIAQVVEESVKDLQALKGKTGLKVNLGCGSDIRPGFVNIDLHLHEKPIHSIHPDALFVTFDLRLGLPLEENSCDFIYSSHFFEHLDYEDGIRLMRDCCRALRSGGIFRMTLPDFRIDFDAYLRGDDDILCDPLDLHDPHLTSVVESETMTRVDWINYSVYQSGEHKYLYDEEKAILLLLRSGFKSAAKSSYREGIDIDKPIRRDYSFYIEAVK